MVARWLYECQNIWSSNKWNGEIEFPTDVKLPKNTKVYVVIPEMVPLVTDETFPLKGTVLRYDDPFEPAVPVTAD